jgi:hypothetical protein
MAIKTSMLRVLLVLCLIWVIGTELLLASSHKGNTSSKALQTASPPASQPQSPVDVNGTWSGAFESNFGLPPFTMTIVINRDPRGHLVGASSLNSDCFKESNLQVTVNGSNVVIAGSDQDGDTITFRGTVDGTGTLLNLNYIINGSASGRCESDRGSGNLGKR